MSAQIYNLAEVAKDAAERVAKNANVPAQLCHAPILFALKDAEAGWNDRLERTYRRIYLQCFGVIVAVLGASGIACWINS